MVVFSLVECLEGRNLRYDWFLPDFRGVCFLDNFLRYSFLFRIMVENCRSVLSSNVCPLAVQCGRVVCGKEDLQDLLEGNLLGIEGYLDRLRVSCGSRANILVGWVRNFSTGIA